MCSALALGTQGTKTKQGHGSRNFFFFTPRHEWERDCEAYRTINMRAYWTWHDFLQEWAQLVRLPSGLGGNGIF